MIFKALSIRKFVEKPRHIRKTGTHAATYKFTIKVFSLFQQQLSTNRTRTVLLQKKNRIFFIITKFTKYSIQSQIQGKKQ